MKEFPFKWQVIAFLSVFFISCERGGIRDSQAVANEAVREVIEIFENMTYGTDSMTLQETDSSWIYRTLPLSDEFEPEKQLYGTFIVNKNAVMVGKLNDDPFKDAVVEYSFLPYHENNQLTYFKMMLQNSDGFDELAELFGGGRCEGPILEMNKIVKGKIYFDVSDYAPGDACCCPSIKSEKVYQIENDKLLEIK